MEITKNNNKIKVITEYLLYLLVFIIPWQIRYIFYQPIIKDVIYEYGTYSLYGFDILLGVIFVLTCINLFQLTFNKQKIILKKHFLKFWILYSFFILSLFSSIWALSWGISLFYILKYFEGIIFIFLLNKVDYKFEKLLNFFLASVLVQGIIGIFQFIYQTDLFGSNKWLGVSEHSPKDLGVSVINTGARRWLRSYAFLPHPNILAGFLGLGWVVSIYKYLRLKIVSGLKTRNKNDFFLASFIIFTFALLTTFSRAVWVSCFVVFVILVLFSFYSKKFKLKLSFLKLGTIGFLIVINFFLIYKPLIFTRFNINQNRLEQISINERVSYINQSKNIIKTNFLFGVGIGNFTKSVYELEDIKKEAYYYQPVHNIYLLLISELGLLGFVLLLLFITKWAKLFLFLLNNLEIVLFSGFSLTIMVTGFFDHYWLTLHSGIVMLFFVIGICSKFINNIKENNNS